MCVCWARPANGCTQYFQIPVWGIPHPPASGRLRPHPCKTLGQYSTDATAAQERLGLLDILYREHYSTGLIRLKTLAGWGGAVPMANKNETRNFSSFQWMGWWNFFEIKNKQLRGRLFYIQPYSLPPNFSMAKLDEPHKEKRPSHSTLVNCELPD